MGGYIQKVFDEATDHQSHLNNLLANVPVLLEVPGVHSEADVITGNEDHFGLWALMVLAPLDRCHVSGCSLSALSLAVTLCDRVTGMLNRTTDNQW